MSKTDDTLTSSGPNETVRYLHVEQWDAPAVSSSSSYNLARGFAIPVVKNANEKFVTLDVSLPSSEDELIARANEWLEGASALANIEETG